MTNSHHPRVTAIILVYYICIWISIKIPFSSKLIVKKLSKN